MGLQFLYQDQESLELTEKIKSKIAISNLLFCIFTHLAMESTAESKFSDIHKSF